jgi:hypothetical protein
MGSMGDDFAFAIYLLCGAMLGCGVGIGLLLAWVF